MLFVKMNWLYMTMVITAVVFPKPVSGIRMENNANVGMAYIVLQITFTGSASALRRYISIAIVKAITNAMPTAVADIHMCSARSLINFS
jgi:hypothetical protein